LQTLFIVISLTLSGSSQQPDGFDTLYTRSEKILLLPKYDTVHQLEVANQVADSLLQDLKELEMILCKMQKDTVK
jgi:hypothetical protein